jgi:hypothetical protein
MAKYRKKPVEIEAIQWDGENTLEVLNFTGANIRLKSVIDLDKFDDYKEIAKRDGLKINTLEGVMKAIVNDFIIKGVQGEFYPCKPDIFEQTYEKV